MKYKKIIKDNLTYHLIETNRFKSVSIVSILTKEFDKKDLTYSTLLTSNLMYSSKKYNTKEKIASYTEDLYGAKVSASFQTIGSSCNYTFSLDFINPKYTDNKYLDKSIEFFKEVLLNPNIINNHFNDEYFDLIKKDNINNINSIKDNPSQYASIRYSSIMNKGTPLEYSNIPNIEDLEKITSKSLYDYYRELFSGKFKIDIFILGEVEDSIIEKIHDLFKNIKSNNEKITLSIKCKNHNKGKEVIDSLKYNQSKLYLGYVLDDLNYHEMNHVLKLYNTILGTMNDSVLFNIVREENSLCYSIGSYVSKYTSSLVIYAGINKTNYEKTVELIKKCVNDMSNKKVVKRLFESAKKTINTYLNNYYDDSIQQIDNYYLNEFEQIEDIETLRKNINEVSIDEVIELNKKISLSTIYMLKGDN